MTKLQKRAKPEPLYLPVALQAGVPSATSSPLPSRSEYPGGKPDFTPLSPFQKTHRRAASTPRTTQTQWPLIANSSPPSMAYPIPPHHDTSTCGANCTRCGKKRLIQLNSPPSANIPTTAAPLRPIPQAHMRAVSEGVVTKGKRLSITTTPAALTPGRPPCCQKCGRHRRPASLPVQSSSKHVKMQIPPTHPRRHPDDPTHNNYSVLRTNFSGTNSGTPHPSKLPSRPPSPLSPSHFYPRTSTAPPGEHDHIISPLSPRRKVDFAFPAPSKSSSGGSNTPYSPISQSEETAEIGTGRLINLISNAIRETSPPFPTAGSRSHVYTPLHSHSHSRNTSVEAVVGLGLGHSLSAATPTPHPTSTSIPPPSETHPSHLLNARSPISLTQPNTFHPVELDSIPIGSTTADILSGYGDETTDTYAEYTHDWTDALSMSIPVIRLPSVKEGISRFKSLRGGGGGGGVGRRPSVRERFGSLRGSGNANGMQQQQQQQGWYGGIGRVGSRREYQALGSSVEVGVY